MIGQNFRSPAHLSVTSNFLVDNRIPFTSSEGFPGDILAILRRYRERLGETD